MNDQDKKEVKKIAKDVLVNNFQKRIGDTPTDSLQLANRKYINMNGTTVNRPKSSIIGQFYLDTSIGRPVYWSGTKWIDGAGSIS